jgi:hypothetical protein
MRFEGKFECFPPFRARKNSALKGKNRVAVFYHEISIIHRDQSRDWIFLEKELGNVHKEVYEVWASFSYPM